MRLLIAEDDDVLAHGLRQAFQGNFVVDHCSRVSEARVAIAAVNYDCVLLDLGLRDGDGLDVLKEAVSRTPRIPVLILTARDALQDRVKGLNLGADDYVTKPFDLPELEARVRALIRRKYHAATAEMTIGNMRFDSIGKRVYINDEPVDLSQREVNILELLVLNAGKIVSKDQILEKIGSTDDLGVNAIEVYVHRIRKKIAPEGFSFRTVRGLGYLLERTL